MSLNDPTSAHSTLRNSDGCFQGRNGHSHPNAILGELAVIYGGSPRNAARQSPHLDDHLAYGLSTIDVGHGLSDRIEWKDAIHDWAYNPGIDERRDLP